MKQTKDAQSGFAAPLGSATLSDDANKALCWLLGEQAAKLRCGEARAAILEGFGPKVDAELQTFFCSPNAEVSRPAPKTKTP